MFGSFDWDEKSLAIYDIVNLISDDVITVDDLEECSEEL